MKKFIMALGLIASLLTPAHAGTLERQAHQKVCVTPVLDTNAYAAGDRVGSIMTFTPAHMDKGGYFSVTDVFVVDQALQSVALNFWMFDALPVVASADNAALDITDAEMIAKAIGYAALATGDYVATASNSLGQSQTPGYTLRGHRLKKGAGQVPGGKSLFVVMEAGALATPTYAAGSLKVCFKFRNY